MDEIVEEEEEEDEVDGSEDDDDGSSDDEAYEDDDEKSGSGSDESSKSDSDDDEGSGSDSGSDLDDERSRRVVDEPEERVRRAAPRASREDVADFEREMAKFLGPAAKNIHATGATPGAGAAPGRVSGGYARVGAPGVAGSGARVAEVGTGPGSGGVVAFKMLIRKDGKQTARRLDVPAEADFVVRARVHAEAEARERAELKRLVLASASADDSEQADDDPVAVAAASYVSCGTSLGLSSASKSATSWETSSAVSLERRYRWKKTRNRSRNFRGGPRSKSRPHVSRSAHTSRTRIDSDGGSIAFGDVDRSPSRASSPSTVASRSSCPNEMRR